MTLPYLPTGHTDCDAPLGLVVHDGGEKVRLPIINDGLQLYERKLGPTAITRRAEATIPIEDSDGTDWTSYVSAFSPVGAGTTSVTTSATGVGFSDDAADSGVQIADVIGQPLGENGEPAKEPSVLFRGYVGAVGSRDGVNRARLQVYDPMKLLGQVAAGRAFTDETTTRVLKYVASEYQASQNVFDTVSVSSAGTVARPLRQIALDDASLGDIVGLALSNETLQSQFTFSTNRDTLVDVVEWVQETANIRVWFQPTGTAGLALVAVDDGSETYDLTPSSERIPYVIKNNALYELSPINGVKVKGATGRRVGAGPIEFNLPFDDTYVEATAVYPPLVERYGGELLKTVTSKETDGDILANQAAAKLKDAIDAENDGEMVTTLAPQLHVYDRVTSTPACAGVTTDVPSLRYEIQEAVHSVVPSDNNLPRTELTVSMSIRPDDIVTEKEPKNARGGGAPTEDNTTDEYAWRYGRGSP